MPDDVESVVRFPRGRVTVNGKQIPFVSFEVILNQHQEASQFDVQAALFDPQAPYDWKWWAENTDIEVEISLGFADDGVSEVSSWTSLIVGPVDGVAMSPLSYGPHSTLGMRGRTEVGRGGMLPNETGPPHPQGAVLQIRGRDYAGQLIDSQLSHSAQSGNLDNQEYLKQMLAGMGLQLDLSEVPEDSIGTLSNALQSRLNLHRSAWDVVSAAAEHEGLRASVKGRTLKIAPPVKDSSQPYQLFYIPAKLESDTGAYEQVLSNCMTLSMKRGLNVGRGTDHFVQSYDSSTGRRPSRAVGRNRSSQRSARKESDQMSGRLTYTDNIPGATPAQVKKHAAAKANHVAKFERDIEFQIPGDVKLTIDTKVQLTGTGTEFDQTYEMNQLTHFFDLTQGYRIEARARNRSDDVETTVEEVSQGTNPKAATKLNAIPPARVEDLDE